MIKCPLRYNKKAQRIVAVLMDLKFDIHLLGGFRLLSEGQPLGGLASPRLQSLVAYLVLHRDAPQPRRQLAFLLWPDSSEDQARTNIRKMILSLRRALPDPDLFLRDDRTALQWRPDAPFRLDVAEFEAASASGDCERAVALYTGELLPECYDDWIEDIRERLRRTYLEVLERLIRRKEDDRDYSAALGFARQLLRCDPLREEIHRHIMRLYALKGDRAAALHAYQNCSDVLQKELSVVPSPATRQVYESLLRDGEGTQNIVPLANTFPLIGRAADWARLQEIWHDAARGNPQLVLISGEAGIGKTRLADELLVWADRQSISVAGAACYAAEGASAYAPVTTWLRGRPLSQLEPGWRSEVARLLPELAGDAAKPGPLNQAWQLERFHEALARAVLGSDLAANQPVLLLLDDLQWCDGDTLAWLNYLLRICARARLLVVGTLRTEAMPEDGPLPVLLADLRRRKMLTEIALHPLEPSETTRLGETALGQSLDAEAAAELFRETEGNPLFIVEFARAGLVRNTTDTTAGTASLPPLVQAAIVSHLTRLSQPALDIVRIAAVIGREFTFGVLRRTLKQDEEILLEALDELLRRGVIREQGKDVYSFSHDKLRQVAYDRLSATRRRVLHKRVAGSLSQIYARQPGPVSGQIGWHFEQAGETQAAAEWLWKAGDYSANSGAYVQAVGYLKHALDLLAEDDPRRAELLCRIGTESAFPYGGDQELDFLRQGLDLAKRIGDRGMIAKASLSMSRAIATRGQNLDANRLAQTALEHAEAAGDQETKAGTFLNLGMLAYYRREHTQAIQSLKESLVIFRRLQDTVGQDHSHSMGRAMNYLGLTFLNQGDFEQAGKMWRQTLRLAEEKGDRPVQAMVTLNLGWMAFIRGEYAEAEQREGEAIRLCRGLGDHGGLAVSHNTLGHMALHNRLFEKAKNFYCIGLREATYSYVTPMVLETLAGLAGVWSKIGNPVRAAEWFGLAIAHPHTSPEVAQVAPYIRQLFEEVLSPADLEAALQRGSRLDLDQAVKEVMKDLALGEVPSDGESHSVR